MENKFKKVPQLSQQRDLGAGKEKEGASLTPPAFQLSASSAGPVQMAKNKEEKEKDTMEKIQDAFLDLAISAYYHMSGITDEEELAKKVFLKWNPDYDGENLTKAQKNELTKFRKSKIRPYVRAQRKFEKEKIGEKIEENREDYGVPEKDVDKHLVLNKGAIRDKIKFFQKKEFQDNMRYSEELLEKEEVKKTSLGNSEMAKDKGLVLSFLSRETGPIGKTNYYGQLLKDPEKFLVTCGSDVHPKGKAGFDYLYKYQKDQFDAAGEEIKEVPESELKAGKKDRKPGEIKAKNFLFATMGLVANCEKNVRGKMGDAAWGKLSTASKRIWIAVAFARPGGGLTSQIKKIEDHYAAKKEEVDFNSINDSAIAGSSGVLERAKALALRAEIFGQMV